MINRTFFVCIYKDIEIHPIEKMRNTSKKTAVLPLLVLYLHCGVGGAEGAFIAAMLSHDLLLLDKVNPKIIKKNPSLKEITLLLPST